MDRVSRVARVMTMAAWSLAGFVILLVCWLVRPLRLVRFGHLYTSRIGHLCLNCDNYLAGRRARASSELAVFTKDRYVANATVFDFWKRHPGVAFTQIARPALSTLHRFFPRSPALISHDLEMHVASCLHSISPALVSFTTEEREAGEAILEAAGVFRPFVCMHNRDSAYLEYLGGDPNRHDYRDFAFEDFAEGIRLLVDLGYSVVRIGRVVKKTASIRNPRFVSLAGEAGSGFADVYAISECSFFVGGTSGVSHVSRLFRKPELLVNYIPFRLPELSGWAARSVVVPKKLYTEEKGRLLRFSEMAALPYDIHYEGDFFGDHGVTVVNNSPAEIAAALLEMEARMSGQWADSEEQKRLQSDFWNSMPDRDVVRIVHGTLGTTVASTFLERNPELI